MNDAINTYIEEQYIPNSVLSQLNSPYEFEKCDFDIPHFIRIYNNGLDEEINVIKSVEMIKKLKSQKIE